MLRDATYLPITKLFPYTQSHLILSLQFVIYGASNFLNFILGEVFLFVLGIFDRIYLDGILEGIWHILVFIYDRTIDFIISRYRMLTMYNPLPHLSVLH